MTANAMDLHEFYAQCFFIVLNVLISRSFLGASSNNKCEGRPGQCCEGLMLNESTGECIECDVGYVGKNCSLPCPYNSYGKRCQMTCNCTKDECDFIRGCEKRECGNETTTEISEVTTERMEKKPKISDRNLLEYILVGLSSLVGFVCIMHIALHYYKKK